MIMVMYFINVYLNAGNYTTDKPMKNITELRHHYWLMRTGMEEHAQNFNGFGLRKMIRRKTSRRGLI